MQPLNAIAVRQPANTPPAAGPAAPTPAPNEPPTAESLGWQLRAALPPLRLHSVSLYDEQANVLWLSEGALGPDEHNVVVEAIEALRSDMGLNCYESGLEDGRIALFLPVRSPQGGLVGLAMILADMKSTGDGVIERLATPQIRTILQKVAVLLRAGQPRTSSTERVQLLELPPESQGKIVPDSPDAQTASPVLSPHAVEAILEFELTRDPLPQAPAPSQAQRQASLAAFNSGDLRLESDAGGAGSQPVAAVPTVGSTTVPTAPNVAPFPSPSAAAATEAMPPAAAAPPAVVPVVHSAPAAARPVNSNSTTTSKALGASATSTSKVLPAATTGTSKVLAPYATGTSKMLAPAATATSKTLVDGATDTSRTLGATSTSRVLAMPEGMSLALEVQPFSKLRSGGRTRRYEVLARPSHPNRVPAGIDKIVLQQLLAWMAANRSAWSLEPTSFTLNLSISTLEDERFPQFVASNLKAHGIAADNIGFEIAEALCLQRRAQVERFITLCDKLGCFVVIDEFSLDSSVVSLLRSKALRLVKIDPKLTSVALKDKLAQAMVVAIVQAVKVLGIHCAAKRVDSQNAMQWLTAIGCDFAQGTALAQTQTLESLSLPPVPPAAPPSAA